jgi:hypothetical protein
MPRLYLALLIILPIPSARSQSQQQAHPDFTGIWRVRETTPPSENLTMVSTQDDNLRLKTFSQYGTRYTLNDMEFKIGSPERTGTLAHMPARFKANWDDNALILEWTVVWPWGEQSEHHRWIMNPDGKGFRDDFSDTFKTRVRQHVSNFDRAPSDVSKFFAYPEQTSGEHFKNVQVLKDLPGSEMTPLMGRFQAALGAGCTHCHNQSAYDSDEKESKKTARRMISMTLDLNRREFQGRSVITCNTCHRGKPVPAVE